MSAFFEFLQKIRDVRVMMKTILQWGPDRATIISRNVSFVDAAREAALRWEQEVFELLPRRYIKILDRLQDEGLLSDAAYESCIENIVSTIIGPDISKAFKNKDEGDWRTTTTHMQFPWVVDQSILKSTSAALQTNIIAFMDDHKKVMDSAKGVFLLCVMEDAFKSPG